MTDWKTPWHVVDDREDETLSPIENVHVGIEDSHDDEVIGETFSSDFCDRELVNMTKALYTFIVECVNAIQVDNHV